MKKPEVITTGEILVEIMRKGTDASFLEPGIFLGPYPSGAPGIFISAVSRISQKKSAQELSLFVERMTLENSFLKD